MLRRVGVPLFSGVARSLLLGVMAAGCFDPYLDAPYVLTSGLGEVRSLVPDVDRNFIVATPDGIAQVAGDGRILTRAPGPAFAVSSFADTLVVLGAGTVEYAGHRMDAPGAVDVLAGWDGEFWVLTPQTLVAVNPATGLPMARADGFGGARAVALGVGHGHELVVTATTLTDIGPIPREPSLTPTVADGGALPVATVSGEAVVAKTVLASGLLDARAAAIDGTGRIYVAQGNPTELWRVSGPDEPLIRVAQYLGDVRDLHFGPGGLLPPDTLYIATGDGVIEYLRPP